MATSMNPKSRLQRAAVFFMLTLSVGALPAIVFGQAAIQNPSAEAQIDEVRRELGALNKELEAVNSTELSRRLAELETRLNAIESNIENSVSTIAATSSNTISAMSWFLYITGAFIGVIVGVAVYFGYRRIQDIGRSYEREFENAIDEINGTVAESESKTKEIEARLTEIVKEYEKQYKEKIDLMNETHSFSKANLDEAEKLLSKSRNTARSKRWR